MTAPLLATPLATWHAAHGGRMVDFAGWTMPVQYASIVDEHLATRRAAGIFDVSHMGRLAIAGPAAIGWLDALLTRRVADLAPGQVRYTLVTSDEGPTGLAILDDALVAREADAADGSPRLSLVVNASNRDRVVAWLRGRLPAAGVSLTDHTRETAMIAVQGPRAVELVAGLCPAADATRIMALKNYRATTATVAGRPAAVSRTGYTGEDGLELVVPAADAVGVWEAILAAGSPHGVVPCGLGARDTLRLEAGMPLYGHELVAASDPFALGLAFAVNLAAADGKPREFPGAAPLRRLAAEPAARVRVGLVCEGRRAAREGAAVTQPGDATAVVGVVTSGSYCPTLGAAAAMALVDRAVAAPGTRLDLLVRDTAVPARVAPLPLSTRPAART
ncbi:MAG: glycine cleavage system aminomethyltransferase GcvT [Planctomycetota bacterium]